MYTKETLLFKGVFANKSLFVLLIVLTSILLDAKPNQIDLQELDAMSTSERSRFVHDLQLETMDSALFLETYRPLLAFAESQNDWRMKWDLQLYFFHQRGNLHASSSDNIALLNQLETTASEKNFAVGQIAARHFLSFEKYYANQLSHKELYIYILKNVDKMKEVGFEEFADYYLIWILYYDGHFMYQLGDFAKALQFFQLAEQLAEPFAHGDSHAYILIQNHLQSIYKKQNDFSKGISHAKKILDFAQSVETNDPEWKNFYRYWEGLSSSDIAAMLVKQGKLNESKHFAERGYELTKINDTHHSANLTLAYDALQVLVDIKLRTANWQEAEPLIRRLDELFNMVGDTYDNYFNNIEYFKCRERYHELKGEYAEAIHFANLAKPLQDSLTRRNDARELEQLKQRLAAEKFQKEIELIEQEKEIQTQQRNVAFLLLFLVLISACGWIYRLKYLRRQKETELKVAQKDLNELTRSFQQKAEVAKKLELQIAQFTTEHNQNQYLEQLTSRPILNEEDWRRFQQLFEKAYPGFLDNYKRQLPNLTKSELRYLALEKLGLNNNEMAKMLGVSSSAIRKTKSRVRKKVTLEN